MGPFTIDLFCLLIFTSSVTEIQVCKISCSIRANNFPIGRGLPNWLARNYQENVTLTSHSGNSVTDMIRINKQNKSIATGPTLNLKGFERSYLKMWRLWTSWGIGPRNVASVPRLCVTPNYSFAYQKDVAWSVENRKLIVQFEFYVINYKSTSINTS